MKPPCFLPSLIAAALIFAFNPAATAQPADAPVAAAAAKTFSQQDLDQLLAPIALYPDPLLAQVLMASTYPLEVVQASRWAKENAKLTGKALEDALTRQPWDPAVKSLTAVPQVLQQMNDKLDWTQKLGDAFLAQQQDVMDTVQILRAKAHAAGNLKSSEQQVVKTEAQGSQTIYIVESAKPEVVYVPTYNPTVVYGSWWYPAPPYTMYPPAYVYAPGIAFATGVVVGAAIWGGCHWGGYGRSNVNVNVNRYNSFNRTSISNTNNNWNHNAQHRGGVAYADKGVAQQYNRGGAGQNAQSREANRGYGEAGRGGNRADTRDVNRRDQGADRGQGAGRGQSGSTRDRPSASTRDAQRGGGSDFDRGGRGDGGFGGDSANRGRDSSGGGFSGVNNGASTREASQRGGASRSEMGGGGNRASAGGYGGGGGARAGGGGGRAGGGRGGGGGRR